MKPTIKHFAEKPKEWYGFDLVMIGFSFITFPIWAPFWLIGWALVKTGRIE